MVSAIDRLAEPDLDKWLWWKLPQPPKRTRSLIDLIETDPVGVTWHSNNETERLVSLMSVGHLQRLDAMKSLGKQTVGTIYKRMRIGEDGQKHQRAELRWDGIAGCLRTPGGGSSRQTLMIVNGGTIKSRLLSPREAARLMGLPDTYRLPGRYNDAYHVAGDGLVVPVVSHISRHLLEPILQANDLAYAVAAE
jgi:DNA (cytosine-5)-methyltransferase 1